MATSTMSHGKEKEDSDQAFESGIDADAFKKDIDSFAERVDIHERIKSSRTTEELSLEGDRLFKQLDEFYHEVQQKRVLASMRCSSFEDLTDDEQEQFVEMLHERQLAWEMTYSYGDTHDKTLTIALKKLDKIKNETSATEKHGPQAPVDSLNTKEDTQNECVIEPITFQDGRGFAIDHEMRTSRWSIDECGVEGATDILDSTYSVEQIAGGKSSAFEKRGAQLFGDKPREAVLTTTGKGTSACDSFMQFAASQSGMRLNSTKYRYSSSYSQSQPKEIQGRRKVSWES